MSAYHEPYDDDDATDRLMARDDRSWRGEEHPADDRAWRGALHPDDWDDELGLEYDDDDDATADEPWRASLSERDLIDPGNPHPFGDFPEESD